MARLSIEKRVERQTGKAFVEVLTDFSEARLTPEAIAGECRCSLSGLLTKAAEHGFQVVKRLERVR